MLPVMEIAAEYGPIQSRWYQGANEGVIDDAREILVFLKWPTQLFLS